MKGIGPNKFNGLYTDAEKEKFASDPAYHEKYRLDLWDSYETRFFQFQRNSEMQKEVVKIYRERYEREVRPELREKIMPNYGVGCRRITPSDTYLKALQAENTELVTEPIKRITPKGIETTDGRLHECDLLILATGFDTSFKPVFPLIGRGGKTLQEEWKIIPESYLSVGAPGFPNYWMVIGPNSPLGQNSLLPWLEGTVDYIYESGLFAIDRI